MDCNLKKDYRNWPSNVHSVSHLTQRLLLHYLGKAEHYDYRITTTTTSAIKL